MEIDIASSSFSILLHRQVSAVAPAAALPMFRCTQSPPTVGWPSVRTNGNPMAFTPRELVLGGAVGVIKWYNYA